MTTSNTLRLRAVLTRWFTVILAVLLVLAAISGWVAYGALGAPETTTEQRVEDTWRTTGTFDHEATVTENNSVYPVGTTLTNRSVYFQQITPELDGTFTFEYRASGDGELKTDVELSVVQQAVEEQDGEEVVVWQRSRSVTEQSVDTVEPGETTSVPFTVDVPALANETDQIDAELGEPPGEPEILVKADVRMTGTVNGERVNQTVNHALPIQLDGNAYRIDGNTVTQEEFAATRSVTSPQERSAVVAVGAPLVFLTSLAGIGGLLVVRRRGALLDEDEQEFLTYRDDRAEFDDWITNMSLPDRVDDLPRASAKSLADLADFAIDTDNGVVRDPDREAYFVIHDDVAYTYEPPRRIDDNNEEPSTVDDQDADTDRPDETESGPIGNGETGIASDE